MTLTNIHHLAATLFSNLLVYSLRLLKSVLTLSSRRSLSPYHIKASLIETSFMKELRTLLKVYDGAVFFAYLLNEWPLLQNFFIFIGFLCLFIVIRNGKIVWKHGPYCWYFRLNLRYLGWPYRAYIKTTRNGDFCEELLSENDFEAVLANFSCYDYDAKASEAVQKNAADQKEYRKCSSCVIICWIAKIYLSINNSEKWLVTRIPPT